MESSSLGSRILLIVALTTAPTLPTGLALRRTLLRGTLVAKLLELAICALPALVCVGLVIATAVGWLARRPSRFGAGIGAGFHRSVACLAIGAACGWYGGSLHAWDELGPHTATLCACFGPYLLSLLACATRRPAWRGCIDAIACALGFEAGAQLGHSWSKGRLHVFDDITATNAVFLACALVAAALFAAAHRLRPGWDERLRRAATPPRGPDGIPLPRRAT